MNCKLYTDEEYYKRVRMDMFEVVERYQDGDHDRQLLLECKECGQLYYYTMQESTDWVNGNDPIFRTYTPVNSKDEVQAGKYSTYPRLQYDWPSNQESPKIWWNSGDKL